MAPERNEYQKQKTNWVKDPGNALLLTYILVILFLLLFCSLKNSQATEKEVNQDVIKMDEVQRGELLIPAKTRGTYTPVPLLFQDVHISVSGIVARALVKQRFANRSDEWVEAIYVFPLPDESSVDHLRMKVGDRVIIGEIKEKKKAKAIYEKAKREGKKSSLLVQNRANIFTTSVANIGPGETIEIEIEYQQVVHFESGTFSLRFPMVVGPRYIPGATVQIDKQSFSSNGWSMNSNQVPDAAEITPPVIRPGEKPVNPVNLSVELSAGFALKRINSLYHGVDIKEEENNSYLVSFNHQVYADRDFVLEYQPVKSGTVQGALFAEENSEMNHLLLMLIPPEPTAHDTIIPRELIFVIDTSGSMAGPSLRQAKEALVMAVSRLHPDDRFNIIEFNSRARSLFSSVEPGDAVHIQEATDFVNALKSNGGTEIRSALSLALDGRSDHERIRQVVFLTDGSVGNERALFTMINNLLGDSRLFTVGIGSAPNSFFMTRAASMGRGSYTYIGKVSEVAEKMNLLFKKLENPVVSSLELTSPDTDMKKIELYPSPLPDLYNGEPLIGAIRLDKGVKSLKVTGVVNGQRWSRQLNIRQKRNQPGVSVLWARKKIRNLMESLSLGGKESEVREQVLTTALQYHLVSKYTSLVAVEQKVSRPAEKQLKKTPLPTNMPAGWKYKSVFGGTARTATPSTLFMIMGALLCLVALALIYRRQVIRL